MTTTLLGGLSGIGAGGILLFLSHIAPRFGAGNYVRDTDALRLFGRNYSRREAHLFGVVFHLALSFLFGACFAYGVQQGVASGYDFIPLGLYALLITVFVGGVVMPLEGHGLFGWKEDAWFTLDLFLTNVGWAVLYGLVMAMWV